VTAAASAALVATDSTSSSEAAASTSEPFERSLSAPLSLSSFAADRRVDRTGAGAVVRRGRSLSFSCSVYVSRLSSGFVHRRRTDWRAERPTSATRAARDAAAEDDDDGTREASDDDVDGAGSCAGQSDRARQADLDAVVGRR